MRALKYTSVERGRIWLEVEARAVGYQGKMTLKKRKIRQS